MSYFKQTTRMAKRLGDWLRDRTIFKKLVPGDQSFLGILCQNDEEMETAFQDLIGRIQFESKLKITKLRIGLVLEHSFHLSLEARLTDTGTIKAKMCPMTIDMWGPSGPFGEMTLPELKVHPNGTPITIDYQLVEIINWNALQVFLEHLLHDEKVNLDLIDGVAEIKSKPLKKGYRPIYFTRGVAMNGMHDAAFAVKKAEITANPPTCDDVKGDRAGLKVRFRVKNPSPVELSFGWCAFEIRNEEGELFAQLKGMLDIKIKYYDVQLCGIANKDVKLVKGKTRLIGLRCSGAGWCDGIIKSINVPVTDVWKMLKALGMDYDTPDPPSPDYFRWNGRWFKKGTWI
ncbi:hypothetical protein F5Y04DRAFT_292935 [Hypomontagnella monticulosa]|nr:hypothetical protein F5Y04DRAFT_292935 [Hypomontagnella monticulosa]